MKRTSLKTLILAFAAICAFPCSGMANDGLFYTSGNQLVPLNESQISVSKEVLTIRLNANGTATVDVQYDFLNPEKEERCVTVGFVADAPQNFTGQQLQETEHPFIKDFTVEMNDTALSFRHATVANDSTFVKKLEFKPLDLSLYEEDESGSGNYLTLQDTHLGTSISYVYYFQATFKPGLNHVHHRYTYTMAQNIYTHYQLDYKLSPALRWANHQIDDFTLRIESDGSPLHFFLNAASMKGTDAPAIVNAAGKKGYGKHQMRDIRSSEYDKQAQQMLEFFLRDAFVEIHAKRLQTGRGTASQCCRLQRERHRLHARPLQNVLGRRRIGNAAQSARQTGREALPGGAARQNFQRQKIAEIFRQPLVVSQRKIKKTTTPNHALQHGWALSVIGFILAFFSKKGFVQ